MNELAYDAVFFESLPNPERHIDRLYAAARLKGLSAVTPKYARVLEIGCSTGGNLLPQALLYSEATFVGVDLSREQVLRATEVGREIGLRNIEFVQSDIKELDRSPASFDYIICHGLFSWVSNQIQEELIKSIAHFLSPQGVAYLSFNTALGWRSYQDIKMIFRELGNSNLAPREKIDQARKMIAFMRTASAARIESKTSQFLTYLESISDGLLLHEYLNPAVAGIAVSDLHERLQRHQLQYFGDARPQRDSALNLSGALYSGSHQQFVSQLNYPEREDFSDLLSPRSFRGALVVNDSHTHRVAINLGDLDDLYFASPLIFLSEERESGSYLFMRGEDQPVHIRSDQVARFLKNMAEYWPVPISGREIFINGATQSFLVEVLGLVAIGAIEVSAGTFGCAQAIEALPITSSFIRLRAQNTAILPTLKHEYFQANDFERVLIKLLDGTHTLDDLAEGVILEIESGSLLLSQDSREYRGKEYVLGAVHATLKEFLEHGLLLKGVSNKI